jgi:hypothetical protein
VRKSLYAVGITAIVAVGAVVGTTVAAHAGGGATRTAVFPQALPPPPAGDDATITVSPHSGKVGTVVTFSNSDSCFGGSATATVTLHDPANQQKSENNVDGSWSVQITVAAGTPAGTYTVSATCTGADESPSDYAYTDNQFTVTAAAPSPTPTPVSSPSPTAAPSPAASPASAVTTAPQFTG